MKNDNQAEFNMPSYDTATDSIGLPLRKVLVERDISDADMCSVLSMYLGMKPGDEPDVFSPHISCEWENGQGWVIRLYKNALDAEVQIVFAEDGAISVIKNPDAATVSK